MSEAAKEKEAPLASRMRPVTLDEIVASSILSEKTSFYTERSRLISSVL